MKWLTDAWAVLVLFLIPIGGGIPAGVLLARDKALAWPTMMLLYLISDVILACVFEPMMRLIVRLAKKSPKLTQVIDTARTAMNKSTQRYGIKPTPFSLILISFGIDPMTGRTAALAAGHNFLTGWTLAIIGDMFFFVILMVSTLWLDQVLGDGTWTVIIITVAMLVIPSLFRRRKLKT